MAEDKKLTELNRKRTLGESDKTYLVSNGVSYYMTGGDLKSEITKDGVAWGTISGNIDSQTDLKGKFDDMSTEFTAEVAEVNRQMAVANSELARIQANPGSTTADQELMGIRTGWDGTNYPTAGQAVQDQFSPLYTAMNAMKTGFDGVTYPSPVEMVQGCDQKLQDEIDGLKDDITSGSKNYGIPSNVQAVNRWIDTNGRVTDLSNDATSLIINVDGAGDYYIYIPNRNRSTVIESNSGFVAQNTYTVLPATVTHDIVKVTVDSGMTQIMIYFWTGSTVYDYETNKNNIVVTKSEWMPEPEYYIKPSAVRDLSENLKESLNDNTNIIVNHATTVMDQNLDNLGMATANISSGQLDIPQDKIWTAGYIGSDGVIITSSNYTYSQKIYVEVGDVVSVKTATGGETTFRALAAYGMNGVVPSAGVDTTSSSYTVPNGIDYIRLTIGNTPAYYVNITRTGNIYEQKGKYNITNGCNPFRFKSCLDHLFIYQGASEIIIPHESLYHVRLSAKLGFDVIEANVSITSDEIYFVNHLESGKFGKYFHHVDGSTDISNIAANSVTWSWIEENVRYNSKIAKYRTRPCLLTEFLSECRQQNIIPYVTATDANVIDIVNKYMGKNNYIAYGASRANVPDGIIAHWVTKSNKTDILDYCRNIGVPFMYGMANPEDFTDSELREIVDELHNEGFWIGTSYQDDLWYKYSALGFDFNNTQSLVNRVHTGNLYNIESLYGFSDFSYTNATESNGVLTFSDNGVFTPDIDNTVYPVSMFDIELWFNGSVTMSAIGGVSGATYTSDGSSPVFIAKQCINEAPKPTFTVSSGTIIYDVKFSASKC